MNVYANQDKRQDNRNTTSSVSVVYAPQIAHPGATIAGNKTSSEASATSDWKQSDEQGFTGKNAQTTLIVGIAAVAVVGGAVFLLKK